MELVPQATIVLGGQERGLLLDLGTMKHFKKLTGKSILKGGLNDADEDVIGALLFCCLHRLDNSIAESDVDKWVAPRNLVEVSNSLSGMVKDFFPEESEDDQSPLT